ncbi:MAG: single-stranded DNA-binding protein [Microbacteriaceae bacterium]|nr:single-stranded DNA-binding protein [Microbacteriaceae bacterium]
MDIKTQASVSGFIVGDARLQQTKTGEPMLTLRVGQERFEAAPGGGFNQLENHYFNLVQFGKAAESTYAMFKPGDRFVAEGYAKNYEFTGRDGGQVTGQDFVVKKIGHDTAWTRYVVDRTPRTEREAETAAKPIEHDSPDADASHRDVADSVPEPVAAPRSKKSTAIPSRGVSAATAKEPVGADVPF